MRYLTCDVLTRRRLGEATDHFAQSEVEQLDLALKDSEAQSKMGGDGSRSSGLSGLSDMTGLLSHVPGAGDLATQAQDLQARSNAQQQSIGGIAKSDGPLNATGSVGAGAAQNVPGTNIDPVKVAKQIYPILEFRDKVVKMIQATIEKIPGLEALVEKITETLTLFVLSLLAPFVRPIINAVSKQLKAGSGGVINASGKSQYEPWTDPHCSDPTHSLLSKDHFSNILNEPAGQVASKILQYVAPRVIYAWEHPDVPLDQVLNDIVRVFHHPAVRDPSCEVHRNMFSTVERWARSRPDGGANLNSLLSSDSVRHGKNHTVPEGEQSHSHGGLPSSVGNFFGAGSHSKTAGSPWEQIGKAREMGGAEGSGAGGVGDIPAAFPGTQTEYDTSRPPAGPEAGYAAQPSPQPQQGPYGAPSFPPGGQEGQGWYGQQPQTSPTGEGYYGQQGPPQQWQQGYPGQAPPGAMYGVPPEQGVFPAEPQPQQYGYGALSPYGYNPNAPPPGQQGYGAPPPASSPASYYGGGAPH